MSFQFEWPQFDDAFYKDAVATLDNALNKGKKPAIIADRINVKALDMGSIPPELEILEVGDLTRDRFRGIFRMTYSGDAFIELQTNVQANPLSHAKQGLDILPAPSVLFASAPLIVPMRLKLSDLKLHAIIVLVVSRQKGITLVFKNDPLESVSVSSSFDSVGIIQGYIQREIENQLRELFRSDLPSIIHKMSQRWLSDSAALSTQGFSSMAKVKTETAFSNTVVSEPLPGQHPVPLAQKVSPKKHRIHRPPILPRSSSEMESLSVAESIESYDPTYGLRSNAINSFHSPTSLKQFGSLWNRSASNGMKDALEEEQEQEADEDTTLDSIDVTFDSSLADSSVEYERLPGVGGGLISRPRIVHSQSQILMPGPSSSLYRESTSVSEARSSYTARSTQRPVPGPLADLRRHGMQQYFAPDGPTSAPLSRSNSTQGFAEAGDPRPAHRPSMSHSLSYVGPPRSRSHASSLSTTPMPDSASSTRSNSYSMNSSPLFTSRLASSFTSMPSSRSLSPVHELSKPCFTPEPERQAHSPPPFLKRADATSFDASGEEYADQSVEGITLDTRKNELGARLQTLARDFQTLSPFTRDLEFFTARSFPRQKAGSQASQPQAAGDAARSKPKRKRVHRVGSAAPPQREDRPCASAPCASPSLSTTSTFDGMRRFAPPLSRMASMSDYFPRPASESRSLSRVGL